MKKLFVFLFAAFMLFFNFSTIAFADPLVGTWNATKLGTPELQGLTDPGIFQGKYYYTDPEGDGPTIGDEFWARDNSSLASPLNPYYWEEDGLERTSISYGDYDYSVPGVRSQTVEGTRNNGTFWIYGDRLWGQDPGSIYSASIQGEFSGIQYFNWIVDTSLSEGGYWQFDRFEAWISWWGTFDDYLYTFEFSAFALLPINNFYPDTPVGPFRGGTLDLVEFKIEPVPEPATMLLLGSGLIGLAGARRKYKK